MAYGVDNGRGVSARSFSAIDQTNTAEGAVEVKLDTKNGRQAVPSPDMHNDGVWNAASVVSGPRESLGDNPHEGLKDAEYPSPPNVSIPGGSGTTNAGPQGVPVDFNSVAPYEYPDFGDWPNSSSKDPTAALGQ